MVVADASPLIGLAKVRRLQLLTDLYGEVVMGPVVKSETIDAGKAIHASGVEQIEAAVEDGRVQLVRLTANERGLMQRLIGRSHLDRGEAESIAIAASRRFLLVVDDKEARNLAGTTGVDYIGTAGVLLEGFLRKHLDLDELESAVIDLSKVIWLSPVVVAEILKRAREVQR